MSYILQQSDMDTFNQIKSNHPELALANVDVQPIANGTGSLFTFVPDGTYRLDYTFFPDAAQAFLADLQSQSFFNNLQQQ